MSLVKLQDPVWPDAFQDARLFSPCGKAVAKPELQEIPAAGRLRGLTLPSSGTFSCQRVRLGDAFTDTLNLSFHPGGPPDKPVIFLSETKIHYTPPPVRAQTASQPPPPHCPPLFPVSILY